MVKHRVIGTISWVVFLWVLIFFLPPWVYLLAAMFLIGVSMHEFYNMVKEKGIDGYRYLGIFAACLMGPIAYFKPGIELLLISIVCLFAFFLQIFRGVTKNALINIATTIFGVLYIGWLFSFMIKLRLMTGEGLDGRLIALYVLLVTKLSDIVAYMVGTAFGRHKIIPKISPKKTVEGTLAALLTGFLVAVLFKGLLPPMSIVKACFFGLILSTVSQIGDLSESVIKRDCNVKDSGNVLPAFGGALDLIDSLLFTAPILYFCLVIFL